MAIYREFEVRLSADEFPFVLKAIHLMTYFVNVGANLLESDFLEDTTMGLSAELCGSRPAARTARLQLEKSAATKLRMTKKGAANKLSRALPAGRRRGLKSVRTI